MESADGLMHFFRLIASDPRIGVSHISLYCALLKFNAESGCNKTIYIKSAELMNSAKISGIATYHKVIRDLSDFGYIIYQPSFNHRKKSKVLLLF